MNYEEFKQILQDLLLDADEKMTEFWGEDYRATIGYDIPKDWSEALLEAIRKERPDYIFSIERQVETFSEQYPEEYCWVEEYYHIVLEKKDAI